MHDPVNRARAAAVIIGLAILFGLAWQGGWVSPTGHTVAAPQADAATGQEDPYAGQRGPGAHTVTLEGSANALAALGSTGQADHLLRATTERPGVTEYRIEYATPEESVIVGVDFATDTITRLRQRPDGTGTAEQWRGQAYGRLQDARAGHGFAARGAGTFASF